MPLIILLSLSGVINFFQVIMPSIWECNDESMSHIHILTHMTAEVPLWYPASSDYSNQGKDLMNFRRQ